MILILLTLIIIFLFLCQRQIFSSSLRYNFIITLQIFGFLSLLSVEFLSFSNFLNATSVRIFWGLVLFSFLFFTKDFRMLRRLPELCINFWKQDKFLIGISIFIFFLTFSVGLLYAPVTYDSLSYHLPRIEFWIQHQNIEYYSTQTDRNLYQPPLAEYMILQFRIIDNADYFDFFVQWIFGLGACFSTSLIASLISKDKRLQIITFFVAATIPMLILQSGTTQNDLIHAFFISVIFLHFLMDIREGKKTTIIWTGLAIGQAILTKGTAYIFIMPICVWWGLDRINNIYFKRILFSKVFIQVFLMVLLFLVNISTFYFRNYEYVGSPLGVSKELYYYYNNQSHSITDFISVISRNVGLHFGVPGFHKITEVSLLWFHDHILHKPLNNPLTSYTHFDLPLLSNTEDTVSCFLHLILIVFSSIYIIKAKNNISKILLLISVVSFLIFCFIVKFQIWHTRLHLPIFLLMSPLIAIFLNQFRYQKMVYILLSISGIGYATFTFSRPLIKFPPLTSDVYFTHPRNTHYYTFETEYSKKINKFIEFLEKSPYKTIGIKTDDPYGNDPLYPVMYQLRGKKTFIPIQVNNESKKYDTVKQHPDCVIYFTPYRPYDLMILNQHDNYHRLPNNAGTLLIFVSDKLR